MMKKQNQMGIKLTLAAEDFAKCFGIVILKDGDFLIEIEQSKIPSNLVNRLKNWYDDYYKYTGLSQKELESQREQTEVLDHIGMDL